MTPSLVTRMLLAKVGPTPATVAPLESKIRLPPLRLTAADPIGLKAPEAVLPVRTRAGVEEKVSRGVPPAVFLPESVMVLVLLSMEVMNAPEAIPAPLTVIPGVSPVTLPTLTVNRPEVIKVAAWLIVVPRISMVVVDPRLFTTAVWSKKRRPVPVFTSVMARPPSVMVPSNATLAFALRVTVPAVVPSTELPAKRSVWPKPPPPPAISVLDPSVAFTVSVVPVSSWRPPSWMEEEEKPREEPDLRLMEASPVR